MSIHNLLSFGSVMKSIGGVALAIVILLVMVTVHEFGHYIAGKILHFKINEFAVGFGPALLKKRSKKTGETFSLRLIPLGGFCAFDGEDDFGEEEKPFEEYPENEEKKEEEYPEPKGEKFNDQAPWKRIIVLLAGATMNYLLALVFIVMMFAFIGRPTYAVRVEFPEAIDGQTNFLVPTDEPLQTGDVILQIDGDTMYLLTDYMDALDGKKQGDSLSVKVLRGGVEKDILLTLAKDANIKNLSDTHTLLGSMGIYGLYTTSTKGGFFETIGNSFAYSVKIGGTVLRSLGELFTGKLGIDSMGGPVTTIKVTSEAASSSWMSFFNITAFIGVNLAVFNLLPIPALDGCKVIFCLIEWIRKKPVNRKVETWIHFIGIIFLLGFAVLVDLLQLF